MDARMSCGDVRRALMERLDGSLAIAPDALDAHLDGCPDCAAFAAIQHRLDAELTAALAPPALSSSFRSALRREIDAQSTPNPGRADQPVRLHSLADAMPDMLHLAGCGMLTAFCTALLPDDAPLVVAVGTSLTVATYIVLTVLRNSLDESAL